ncbi:uncharacterized protein LOC117321472 [Pecten maximus]|uniref:uncharacterized protein LOC117321472 n=1 Tax=Pecten maximus TaxID=6579 RepID=UPI001458E706|nr:uncharacterized protein LOC117321472 [Pecten maximus]
MAAVTILVSVLLLVGGTVADPFPQKCTPKGDLLVCPKSVIVASSSDTIEATRITFERLRFFNLTREQTPNVTFIGVARTNLDCSSFKDFPIVFLNSIPCEFNSTTTTERESTPTVTDKTKMVTTTTVKSTSTVLTRRTLKTRKPFPQPKTWRVTTTASTTTTTDPGNLTWPDITSLPPVPRDLSTTMRTTDSPLRNRIRDLTIVIAVLDGGRCAFRASGTAARASSRMW